MPSFFSSHRHISCSWFHFPIQLLPIFLLHFTAKYLKRVVSSSLYQFPIKSTPPRLFLSLLTGEMGSNTAARVNSVHTQARVCPSSSRSPLFSHVTVKTRVLGRPFRICPTPPSLLLWPYFLLFTTLFTLLQQIRLFLGFFTHWGVFLLAPQGLYCLLLSAEKLFPQM